MPVQAHTIETAGATWTLNSLPASKGLTVSGHIASILGNSLAGIDLAGDGQSLQGKLRDEVLARIVSSVLERMADPRTAECIRLLMEGLRKADSGAVPPGMPVNFEIEFAQNYGALTKLVAWAIGFNFSSFFDASGDVSAYLQKIELPKAK